MSQEQATSQNSQSQGNARTYINKNEQADVYMEIIKLQKETRGALISFLWSGYEETYKTYIIRKVKIPDMEHPGKYKISVQRRPIMKTRLVPFNSLNPNHMVNETAVEELTAYVCDNISPEQSTTWTNVNASTETSASIIAKTAVRQLVLNHTKYGFKINAVAATSFGTLVFRKVVAVLDRSKGGFFYKGFSEHHSTNKTITENDGDMQIKKRGFVDSFIGR